MAKEHFLEQHDPDRKDFQIDRIILFSDAVFAIAITLLVIEIKAPEIRSLSVDEQLDQLVALIPKFFGFALSFFVVAVYWRSHHRIFGFVNRYTNKLIWLNMLFLLSIVLMPFSSAYYSENPAFNIPLYFYNTNIILTGFINFCLIRYILNNKNSIVTHQPTEVFRRLFVARSATIPAVFLLSIILAPLLPILSRFCPILIWPIFFLLQRYYGRKYNKTIAHEGVATEAADQHDEENTTKR